MPLKQQNRRDFLKNSVLYGGAIFLGCKSERRNSAFPGTENPITQKSKIIIAKDKYAMNINGDIDSGKVLKMLDNAIMNLTGSENPLISWKKIVSPDDRVSLKLNCLAGKGLSTNKELVDSVIYRLLETGIKKENIIVWERLNDDFERAGYQIITDKNQVRYLGNDLLGYTEDFYFFGEVGSLLSRVITDFSNVIINIPVLKDHGIVGASIGMKNMFGGIHNPNKYHINVGDPFVADVSAIPIIKNKVRLVICDALRMQYEAGPPYQPQYAIDYNGIIVGTDPVALDYIGWKIIEDKRKENGLVSLKDAGREPKYIFTAADENHKIGNIKDEMIEVINC
jgi:uncharacterized protein (DUF362 family)